MDITIFLVFSRTNIDENAIQLTATFFSFIVKFYQDM
jgi:hypothetical protein